MSERKTELQHFSHDEHPLFFKEIIPNEEEEEEKARRCEGCGEVISGASYGCSQCNFFLHKLCAELPQVIEHHPLHPQHPLTLHGRRDNHRCDVCRSKCEHFTYACSPCDFDMDLICASPMEHKIDHPSHKHPLTPVRRTALQLCDACGQKHEGFWYQCTTCGHFWIHRDCASLPSTIERSDHKQHPLTLSYTIPSQYATFDLLCDICRKILRRFYWVYYCGKCRYFTHVTCVPPEIEPHMSIHPPVIEDHDSDRLYLPPDDIKSINATELLLRRLGLGENERATKLNHFSHDHPLILFDVQTEESESCPGENFKNDDILCEACVKPIFSPFYKCSQCDFILHKCCAELPTELQHPLHPQHELILLPKSPEFLGLFLCQGCRLYWSGFAYGCVDCNFYLDVSCGSLPSTIKHEAHGDHLLHMKESRRSRMCTACSYWFGYKALFFRCGSDTCDFNLHAICSLFPRALEHRYDEHPLILTYSPVEDREADEYYCEICEKEMNPREWFYHCVSCDRSMHTHCALDDRYPNVKFRDILNVVSHRHPLSFARFGTLLTMCSHCRNFIWSGTFKCTKCNYKLCVPCARDLAKK